MIASGRVALAAASLFGVWWDPAEPTRYVAITYTLNVVYLTYALVLGAFLWTHPARGRVPLVTHVCDIIFVSVLQYLTAGPSSPFFLYFVFSLFSAAMRWDWRATLATAGAALGSYLVMTAWMSRTLGPTEFEGDRFVIRSVYLLVVAAILVYLGQHESRLRTEIERLARWPAPRGGSMNETVSQLLEHAAGIVRAARVVAIWDAGEEPAVLVARWPAEGRLISTHPPGALHPPVSPELEAATFVAAGAISGSSTLLVPSAGASGGLIESQGHLHPEVFDWVAGMSLTSASFKTELVSGRVFFTDLLSPPEDLVALTEVVARELGASLDQLYLTEQMKEIAAAEERLRVARDLHDGMLQSLTGVRLEIRALAGSLEQAPAERDRLLAIERALAIEQRELRFFIGGLGSRPAPASAASLAGRLDVLRERIALEWKMPVTIRCATESVLPEHLESAVPLMVHEAIVNALKHGQPSRVAVTLDGGKEELRIVVADDGHGFPFRGSYDHAALSEARTGPQSLLDRVAALGGRMSIESTDAGSRVEMVLAL